MLVDLGELEKQLEEENPDLRQEACHLLSKVETSQAADLLARALRDPDIQVRGIARRGLARLDHLGIKPDPLLLRDLPPITLTRTSSKPVLRKPSTPPNTELPSPTPSVAKQNKRRRDPSLKPTQEPGSGGVINLRKGITSSPSAVPPVPPASAQDAPSPVAAKPSPRAPPPSAPRGSPPATMKAAPTSDKPFAASHVEQVQSSPTRTTPSKPTGHEKEAVTDKVRPSRSDNIPSADPLKLLAEADPAYFIRFFESKDSKSKIELLSNIESAPSQSSIATKLAFLLDSETDSFVVSKLLKVFAHHHGPGAKTRLEPFLESEDFRIVSNCLEAIGVAGGTAEIELIMKFLDHTEPRIRSTAAQSLWESQPEKAMATVKRMMSSKQVWERDAAKFALQSCLFNEAKEMLDSLEKTIPGIAGVDEGKIPAGSFEPSASPLKKLMNLPVAIGLDNPVPLWLFVVGLAGILLFFFYVAIPIVDMIIPPPP